MVGKSTGKLIQESQVSPSFLRAQGPSASLSLTAGRLLACTASSHTRWCTTIPQSIIPVLQHRGFFLAGLFKKKNKTWSKYVYEPLAVRWMHFPPLWTTFPPLLAYVVSFPASHITSSHACWHFEHFRMQLSSCPHSASCPLHPVWQHWWPRKVHGLPDCLEQPGIPFLTGLQCCSHHLLFSKRTFLGCAFPKMTKHELSVLQPSHCTWQMHRHSPGLPVVHPLSIIAPTCESTSINSVCNAYQLPNLHDKATQRPARLLLISLLFLWLKRPARKSPAVPYHMGPFLWPPFILAFPLLSQERNETVLVHLITTLSSHWVGTFCKTTFHRKRLVFLMGKQSSIFCCFLIMFW